MEGVVESVPNIFIGTHFINNESDMWIHLQFLSNTASLLNKPSFLCSYLILELKNLATQCPVKPELSSCTNNFTLVQKPFGCLPGAVGLFLEVLWDEA